MVFNAKTVGGKDNECTGLQVGHVDAHVHVKKGRVQLLVVVGREDEDACIPTAQ